MSRRSISCLALALATACVAPIDLGDEPLDDTAEHAAALTGSTIIVLTFDDTFADNYQVKDLLASRGMEATFYISSNRIGRSGYLTQAQLEAMEAAGNEIGGHTLDHVNLTTVSADEARRQVCDDRVALLAKGFDVASFAYPSSAQNTTVKQIVKDCGYNSARLVGGLVTPGSCAGCPYANPRPPPDPYLLRTSDSVKATTSLATLQGYVTQAEQHGGGLVPIVFHHVCDGCSTLAVSPATLKAFLDWLKPRAANGTVVATMHQAIGGSIKPGVPATPPASGNLLKNASLETDANADQIPDCWQRGGSGTNTATFALVSTAYDGRVAQRITITSYTSGARRLVSRQDAGTCAPAAVAGRRYTVTARYIANAQPVFTVYYRSASGSWVWFAQSARLPTSSSYAAARYTTPALPTGATHVSVGLSLVSLGTLTMDAFTLVEGT